MTTPLIETLKREAREDMATHKEQGIANGHGHNPYSPEQYKWVDTLITTTARKVLEAVREGVPSEEEHLNYDSDERGINLCRTAILTHLDTLLASTKTE